MTKGFEKVVVGKLKVVQGGSRIGVPEKASQSGKRQVAASFRKFGISRKRSEEKAELAPEVSVAGALDLSSEAAEPSGSVVVGVALAGGPCGLGIVRRMEQGTPVEGAVLGDEQEDQPVHHAQKLLVQDGWSERPGTQLLSQGLVSLDGW